MIKACADSKIFFCDPRFYYIPDLQNAVRHQLDIGSSKMLLPTWGFLGMFESFLMLGGLSQVRIPFLWPKLCKGRLLASINIWRTKRSAPPAVIIFCIATISPYPTQDYPRDALKTSPQCLDFNNDPSKSHTRNEDGLVILCNNIIESQIDTKEHPTCQDERKEIPKGKALHCVAA